MDIFTTSYLRANIVAWLPIAETDMVCYIGDEKDVIAEKLREMAQEVVCISPDCCVNMADRQKFDYIVCIGHLAEVAREFRRLTVAQVQNPREDTISVCKLFQEHLTEKGRLILAVENTFGLKYFAGAKEEGSGAYFAAIEGAEESAAYSKEELHHALQQTGFLGETYYYPFPDYRFAMSIYSDGYLPKQGELIDQVGNFDEERLILFDEAKASDLLVREGKFTEFSNSYLIVAEREECCGIRNEEGECISFVKFSNDRGKGHNIRTYITESQDGKQHLIKTADSKEADAQIENIKKTYQALQELYADTRFDINNYKERKNGVELEFLQGHTMEEELDRLLEAGKIEDACRQMMEVFSQMRNCKQLQPFQKTEAFEKVFGRLELKDGLLAAPVSDIDMIMPNILLQENTKKWTVIDYEWSFHFPVPMNFIVYRAIHYYVETTAKRRILESCNLYEKVGISEEERKIYAQMEDAFQTYVLDGHKPMRQLYRESGKPAYHITSLLHTKNELEHKRMMQVYFDRGNGTREEDCINYHSKSLDGEFHLEIPVDADVTAIRIDPAVQACTADIRCLCFTTSKEDIVEFYGPVHRVGKQIYLFEGEDPYLLITDIPAGERRLLLDMRVETMSPAAAELIAPKIDTKYRIKKMLKK